MLRKVLVEPVCLARVSCVGLLGGRTERFKGWGLGFWIYFLSSFNNLCVYVKKKKSWHLPGRHSSHVQRHSLPRNEFILKAASQAQHAHVLKTILPSQRGVSLHSSTPSEHSGFFFIETKSWQSYPWGANIMEGGFLHGLAFTEPPLICTLKAKAMKEPSGGQETE